MTNAQIVLALIAEAKELNTKKMILKLSYQDSLFQKFSYAQFKEIVAWFERQTFVLMKKGRYYFDVKLAEEYLAEDEQVFVEDEKSPVDKDLSVEEAVEGDIAPFDCAENEPSLLIADLDLSHAQIDNQATIYMTIQVYNLFCQAIVRQAEKIVVEKNKSGCLVIFFVKGKQQIVSEPYLMFYDVLLAMAKHGLFSQKKGCNNIILPFLQPYFMGTAFIKFGVVIEDNKMIITPDKKIIEYYQDDTLAPKEQMQLLQMKKVLPAVVMKLSELLNGDLDKK